MARLSLMLIPLFLAGCGSGVNILPEPFTRERADGKIPVKTELIRQQVRAELAGMPEGEAEVARWQQIETDYHACRLSSGKAKTAAEQVFADCMAKLGYVYMYPIDAEQLHNDIAFEMTKERDKRLAAAKKRQEEKEQLRRQKELDDALVAAVLAAKAGSAAEVKRLIDGGANANKKTEGGFTLLHIAAGKGQTEIALAFVKAGVDVDATTQSDNTPLHLAAVKNHTETALALVKAGANIDAKDNDGWTALHYAAYNGQTETVFAFVKAGADIDIKDDDGLTPLDIAIIKHGKDSAIVLFMQGVMEKQSGKNRQKAEELLRELE